MKHYSFSSTNLYALIVTHRNKLPIVCQQWTTLKNFIETSGNALMESHILRLRIGLNKALQQYFDIK